MINIGVKRNVTEIQVSIIDQGSGIPDTEKEKIFQKFYRINTAHSDHEPGTGLGLAITKSIIERHNGRIEVNSRLGEGTTFTIHLPVK